MKPNADVNLLLFAEMTPQDVYFEEKIDPTEFSDSMQNTSGSWPENHHNMTLKPSRNKHFL